MAIDFAAGWLGGCAGVIIGHPLDTVKVHLQTQDCRNPLYKGSLDCIRQLGIRNLYKGITSPLAGVAGLNAIIFSVYGKAQRRFNDPNALTTHFLAGATAGLFQSGISSPMELAKLRAQVSNENIGPMKCIRDIYKREGAVGVFKGIGVTVIRDVPAFASYFFTYEYLTRQDVTGKPANVTTTKTLLCGGLAGVVSWVFCYPVDVLKSRIQYDGMTGAPKYKGVYDCLQRCVTLEGYAFLFRGLSPTLVRAFPVNAAVFTVVTWTVRLFD